MKINLLSHFLNIFCRDFCKTNGHDLDVKRTGKKVQDALAGISLGADPAVAIVELVNEDSYFFWTFDPRRIPAARLATLERRFGSWAAKRHGSQARALASWGGARLAGDLPGNQRGG